jgi:4-aminobutyrate aminotransferase-like enzyme
MIEIIERDNILENVRIVGKYIEKNLLKFQKIWHQLGDIRAFGFHIGIDFVKDPKTREPDVSGCNKIREAGIRNGIIFGLGGTGQGKNVLKIKPPLITTKKQADEILEKFEKSMKDIFA